jgi:hypothetical protein
VSFWWGTLLLREAIITLLLALALLGAVRLRTGRFANGTLIIVVTGLLMTYMRGGMAIVILVLMPLLVGLSTFMTRDNGSGKRKGISGLAMGLAVALLAVPYLVQRFAGTRVFDSERQAVVADALNRGATSFASAGVDPNSLPMAALQILTGPWPWAWRNLALLAAGFDALLWVGLYLLAYVGSRQEKSNGWAVLLLLVPPVALALYLAQTGTNFGLIMRMRGMNIPFIVPLAALGWAHVAARISARRTKGEGIVRFPTTSEIAEPASGNPTLSASEPLADSPQALMQRDGTSDGLRPRL